MRPEILHLITPQANGFEAMLSPYPNLLRPVILHVNGRTYDILETPDFPTSDPWSLAFRRVLENLEESGYFDGQHVTEFGVGDGRNLIIPKKARSLLGVDIDLWRLEGAKHNIDTHGKKKTPVMLSHSHVIDYLGTLARNDSKIDGRVIMCLPQSPAGGNNADKYQVMDELKPYEQEWGKYGLTLNAGVLSLLRSVATDDLRTVMILSDRVPPHIHQQLFQATGWEVERFFPTEEPVQQDPDTPIAWVGAFDDGERFYEYADGAFYPIPAEEAEQRRQESVDNGTGREGLNVYHHLSIYCLRPKLNN